MSHCGFYFWVREAHKFVSFCGKSTRSSLTQSSRIPCHLGGVAERRTGAFECGEGSQHEAPGWAGTPPKSMNFTFDVACRDRNAGRVKNIPRSNFQLSLGCDDISFHRETLHFRSSDQQFTGRCLSSGNQKLNLGMWI